MRGTPPSFESGFVSGNSDPGLVGAWIPALTGPTGGTLVDVSGHHNEGVLTDMDPGADWTVTQDERIPGYALDFDGTDDNVQVVGTWSLTDWTIYAWLEVVSTTSAEYISDFGAGNETAMIKGFQNGFYNIYGGDYPTGTAADSQIPITGPAVWDNVVWTQRGANIRGYVNGVEHISVTRTVGDFFPSSNLDIGRTFGGATFFRGSIADYRIWDHAKTANEIQELYDDPLAMFRRSRVAVKAPAVAGGRIMSSLAGAGGLAGLGGIAGPGGGLAS